MTRKTHKTSKIAGKCILCLGGKEIRLSKNDFDLSENDFCLSENDFCLSENDFCLSENNFDLSRKRLCLNLIELFLTKMRNLLRSSPCLRGKVLSSFFSRQVGMQRTHFLLSVFCNLFSVFLFLLKYF